MELLYAFIICDLHPFSVIRGEGFKKLVESLSPGFTIPSRTAITNSMETKFEEKKNSIIELFQAIEYFSITADIWTSLAHDSFLTTTVHWIKTWKLQSVVFPRTNFQSPNG